MVLFHISLIVSDWHQGFLLYQHTFLLHRALFLVYWGTFMRVNVFGPSFGSLWPPQRGTSPSHRTSASLWTLSVLVPSTFLFILVFLGCLKDFLSFSLTNLIYANCHPSIPPPLTLNYWADWSQFEFLNYHWCEISSCEVLARWGFARSAVCGV